MKKDRSRFFAVVAPVLMYFAMGGLCFAQVQISEFMAVNDSTLQDEDGEYSDWIELHNTGISAVSLEGWHLTDNDGDLTKWTFPATNMAPKSFLIVFASSKNRATPGSELHTNFKLDGDGEFLALVEPDGITLADAYMPAYPDQNGDVSYGRFLTISNVATLVEEGAPCRVYVPSTGDLGLTWTQNSGFDDSEWLEGNGGVGFDRGSGYEDLIATDIEDDMYGINPGCYIRIPFDVATPLNFDALSLKMKYDDGFAAYINGVLVAAANVPEPTEWYSTASAEHADAEAVEYETFTVPDAADFVVSGHNILAIHGLNRETEGRTTDFLVLPRLDAAGMVETVGFMGVPTPGSDNNTAGRPVTFSPAGRTFVGALAVTLSTATPGGVIRYTLDGTEPTEGSAEYTAPIELSNSTMIRARAYGQGLMPGATCSQGYLGLSADAVSFTSDLPLIVIDNFAVTGELPSDEPKQSAFMAVFEPGNGRSSLTNIPTVTTRIGVRRRGESTLRSTYSKPNLAVETRGETGADRDISLLGLPSDSDWILCGPWNFDRALLRQALPYELMRQVGEYGSRIRFCEVFIDTDSTPVSYASNFMGFYILMERIKRGDERIDVAALDSSDSGEPEITGGYIFKKDKTDTGKTPFYTTSGVEIWFVYPNDEDVSTAQRNWLQACLNSFETALYGSNFRDPDVGYAAHIDVPNWINSHLLNMLEKNVDWPSLSCYMHKDRSGKLRQGGPWDFDRSTGCADDGRANPPDTWDTLDTWSFFNSQSYWWNRLFQDPDFWQKYVDRWDELRGDVFSAANILGLIDSMAAEIAEAAPRHFAKWTGIPPRGGSWEWEINYLKDWHSTRLAWIDDQMPDAPVITPGGGCVSQGDSFTISVTEGYTTYYTLDGSDPRAPGGTPAAQAMVYSGPVAVTDDTIVTTRVWDGVSWTGAPNHSPWSAPRSAIFIVNPAQLIVSELMYHPRVPETNLAARGYTSADFEFVELRHIGAGEGSLLGVHFSDGVEFDFTRGDVTSLAPGGHVVVVSNLEAFTNRYPDWRDLNIAGEYDGSLNDGGERVTIAGSTNETVINFNYSDARGWPLEADGAGHALVPRIMTGHADGSLDYGRNWRPGANIDGSPGRAEADPPRTVVISEVCAHTDTDMPPPEDSNDWIELYNTSDSAVPLAGWSLSDRVDDLALYVIPSGVIIEAHGRLVLTENDQFHTNRFDGSGFGLNKSGDELFLSEPGGITGRVADTVRFKGQENGVSLGRYPENEEWWYALRPTADNSNHAPEEHILISEIMYHPAPTAEHPDNNLNDEYIEIYNPTGADADLWTAAGEWRIDGGVSYTFPPGAGIPAGGYLTLVPFDPRADAAAREAFLAAYSLTNGEIKLLGPYVGQLDNRGERLALERPQAPDRPGEGVSWVIVDEAIYFNRAPWPSGTAGSGCPLQRIISPGSGNDPDNWFKGLVGTPGSAGAKLALVTPGHGEIYFAPCATEISVAIDSGQVSNEVLQVDFFLGTNRICVDRVAPYACLLEMAAEGSYSIGAALTDGAGTVTSRQVVVTALRVTSDYASGVTESSADLNGRLLGGGAAGVAVFWGTTDGGGVASAWDNVVRVGSVSNGAFSVHLDGLDQGETYFYRCRAETDGREGWSATVSTFTTVSFSAWPYRMDIALNGYSGAETLNDFPVLVKLHEGLVDFDYSRFASASGADLRFSDADGGQTLSYDIERWNTNGTSYVWVRVPALSNGVCFTAYWGYAPAAAAPPPYALDGSTWSADYRGVWHLGDNCEDSSPGGLHGENYGAAGAVGVVGRGSSFDGVDDWMAPGLSAGWYGEHMNQMTISLWVNPTGEVMSATPFGVAGDPGRNLALKMDTYPRVLKWETIIDDQTGESLFPYDMNQWQLLSLVFEGSKVYAMKNTGSPLEVADIAPFTPPAAPSIGQCNGAGLFFQGLIDEVRISGVARSTAWLQAAYRTVAEHDSFTSYAPVTEQTIDRDTDGDGLPDEWEQTYFGGTNAAPQGHDDSDGMSNADEYTAGTDPTSGESIFRLDIALSNGVPTVKFLAIEAAGPGYDGLERYYDLLYSSNLNDGAWLPVGDRFNILGENQWVTHTNAPARQRYYRARTRLEQGL